MSSLANPSSAAARGFWRLVWKEVRQYRAVVLTLLGTGLLLQALFLVFQFGSLPVLLVAGVFPVMCGLAIAGTAFAGEHDNATYFGLRALPATRRDILVAKLAVAAGAALLVFALLWLMVFVFGEQVIGPHEYVADRSESGEWVLSSLAMVAEVLVYGALVSLIERNALVAVVKTITLLFIVRLISFVVAYVGVGAWVGFSPQFHSAGEASDAVFVGSYLLRVVFLAAGIALMLRAAQRWYVGERLAIWPGLQRWQEDAPPRTYTAAETAPGIWRRLSWLQVRYFGWIGLAILGAALAVFLWERSAALEDMVSSRRQIIRPEWSIALAMLASVLIGGLTFRAAHARKQLLAQLGVPPGQVWLTQLLLPVAICVLLVALFAVVFPAVMSEVNWSDGFFWGFAVFLLSFFTWGQLCSQQTRSTLPALAWSGLAAGLVGFAYYGLYLLSFDSPHWQRWGAAALTAYPLLESFLRSPSWLAGTGSQVWRWIGIRTTVFTLLAAGLLWKFETEIPYISDEQIGLAQNDGVRPDTSRFEEILAIASQLNDRRRETDRRVRSAHPNVDVMSNELRREIDVAWFAACRQYLERLLELPYENVGVQYLFVRDSTQAIDYGLVAGARNQCMWFMRVALGQVIDAGDIELAERIIRKELFLLDPALIARWAWLPENDSERIRRLIRYVESDIDPQQATVWYRSGLYELSIPTQPSHRYSSSPLLWLRDLITVPRENRALRQRAFELPQAVRDYKQAIESGIAFYRLYVDSEFAEDSAGRSLARDHYECGRYVPYVCTQRFVPVQLAAIAWLRDHPGETFESLDQLVPDYLANIPLDPYTAEPVILERDLRVPLYPESIWSDGASPTSSLFLFSPGGIGVEMLRNLAYEYRRKANTPEVKPEFAWTYMNPGYEFRILNFTSYATAPRYIPPEDYRRRIFPIEVEGFGPPSATNSTESTSEESP